MIDRPGRSKPGIRGVVLGAIALAASIALAGCSAPQPVPEGITASQRSEATSQNLELLWTDLTSGMGAVPRPIVPIVRYTTYVDVEQTITACLRREGYEVTWSAAQGIFDPSPGVPSTFAYREATYVCQARYPEDPAELGFLSSAQEAFLFSYWQTSLVPCLRELGVRTAAPPPIGDFGEGDQAVGPSLNPYLNVLTMPKGTVLRLLYGRCPPYPAQLFAATIHAR